MIRLAMTDRIAESLTTHMLTSDPLEQGAFCLLHKGEGYDGKRLLVSDILLPTSSAWEIQAEHNLHPSAQWLSAIISHAVTNRAGLLFVHSHPNKAHPLGLSYSDQAAFTSLARTIAPMLDGPFGVVVIHPDGWSGVLWSDTTMVPIHRIVAVGRNLRFLSPLPAISKNALDDRQSDALGLVHERLRNLSVVVVGCGGLGSPIAEQLVRMGVNEVILIDDDLLDTPSNVRRIFGAKLSHLKAKPYHPKVDIVGDHLKQLGLGVKIRLIKGDVRVERVFKHLLDADVVLMATDTHGSRAVVNELPSKYLMPVIDVGVRIGSRGNNKLSGLVAETRILTPNTPCLWCRKSISADVVRAENLPPGERNQLIREGYVVHGVGEPEPSVIALTVLGSSLATCALIAMLSEEGEVASSGYWVDGLFGDSHETEPTLPESGCRCRQNIGYGDDAAPPFIVEE
jgi:hypothetical protein